MRPPRSTSTAYSNVFAVTAIAEEPIRPVPVLGFGPMRLRTLSEAECYARCYGGRSDERVNVVRLRRARERSGGTASSCVSCSRSASTRTGLRRRRRDAPLPLVAGAPPDRP